MKSLVQFNGANGEKTLVNMNNVNYMSIKGGNLMLFCNTAVKILPIGKTIGLHEIATQLRDEKTCIYLEDT